MEQFWESLGSCVVRQSPREHDRAVSAISHLPHLVAAALATATADGDLPLASTGWRDTTRVAAADVELWCQILLDNRSHVLKSLDKFEKVLASFRGALDKEHRARLVQLLATGKRNRDAVGN
jgi:prephenate dehydrogenase